MFKKEYAFISQCINGDADLDDINDFIEKWHLSNSKQPLHEFLGMTFEEYSIWVEKPSYLPYIINAKKFDIA